MAADDPSFATTLAHGLDVLAAFRNASGALSNADLASHTGWRNSAISSATPRGVSSSASACWPRPIRCCRR
jgi:hypothetical protein